MNRVQLTSTGLKVSKPGSDVATATEDNLTFNSATGAYISSYMKGSLALSAFSLVSTYSAQAGFEQYTNKATVMYGKTFPLPPMALLLFTSLSATGSSPSHSENFNDFSTGQPYGYYNTISYNSLVDRLEVFYVRRRYQGAPIVDNLTAISYLISNS